MIKVHLNSKFITDSLSNKLTGDLSYVANIHSNSLDEAFEIGQNVVFNWTDSNLVVNLSGKQQRSISAGDVLESENGQRWMVSIVGFTRL